MSSSTQKTRSMSRSLSCLHKGIVKGDQQCRLSLFAHPKYLTGYYIGSQCKFNNDDCNDCWKGK